MIKESKEEDIRLKGWRVTARGRGHRAQSFKCPCMVCNACWGNVAWLDFVWGLDESERYTHRHATSVNYSPSDHTTLQVINLDEFTKAAGVVVVGCLGVSEGLTEKSRRKQKHKVKFKALKSKTCSVLSNQQLFCNITMVAFPCQWGNRFIRQQNCSWVWLQCLSWVLNLYGGTIGCNTIWECIFKPACLLATSLKSTTTNHHNNGETRQSRG